MVVAHNNRLNMSIAIETPTFCQLFNCISLEITVEFTTEYYWTLLVQEDYPAGQLCLSPFHPTAF